MQVSHHRRNGSLRNRIVRTASGILGLALVAGMWTGVGERGIPTVQAQAGPSITLSGTTQTLPFREYATRELGDPWDMGQRTDIGWFTWSTDLPASNLTSMAMSSDGSGNTFFRAQTATSAPSFFMLDSWQPGTAKLGKVGVNSPIDTTVYNVLYVKMKLANQVLSPSTPPVAQVFWSRDTIYYNQPDHPASSHPYGGSMMAVRGPNPPFANAPVGPYLAPCVAGQACGLEGGNWVVHRIPLTIPLMQQVRPDVDRWLNANGGWSSNWGDPGVLADSLRFSPFNIPGTDTGAFQIDWMRLVKEATGNATTISWTGGATYDVVVSTQANCSDFTVVGYSKTTGFQFQAQMLPPGTYRVGLRKPFTSAGHTAPSSTSLDSCSTSTITVQSYPGLTLTSPHPEGSADDFATTVMGNPWDFDALTDFDYSRNVNMPTASFGIVNMAATDAAGTDLGSVRVFRNQSTATGGIGDPHIYTLWPIPSPPAEPGTRARGELYRIDASRYRIATAEVGVERARDSVLGSIGRVIWHVDGDVRTNGNISEIESADIVLRHLDPATQNGNKIVLDTIQFDMADRASLPVETDTAQSPVGWRNTCVDSNPADAFTCNTSGISYRPGVNLFRFDFHEFSAATNSAIRRLKLAALERTGSSYVVRWNGSNPSALTATVALKAVPITNAAERNYRPLDPGCQGAGSIPIASGRPLNDGAYTWTPGSTPGVTSGSEYYVCAQVFVSGNSEPVDEVLSKWPVVVTASSAAPATASPRTLLYAATKAGPSGNLIAVTAPQAVTVSGLSGSWVATPSQPWIVVSNGTGSGAGQFQVSIANPGNIIGANATLTGAVTITPGTAGVPPTDIAVRLTVDQSSGSATGPPFGLVDTPLQNTTGVTGTIGVTGWVLDDVGVAGVKVYRNCLAFEPPGPCESVHGRSVVFVGDATMVTGARSDIEALYPTYPQSSRAAWGYLLMTNLLPHLPNQQMFGGQGTLSLSMLATDVEGRRTWLGRTLGDTTQTNFTMANDSIAKPFGAIDTPAQGATVSGAIQNFGWALTPDSNTTADGSDIVVPTNGSTITVYVDGVARGTVTYNQCRGTSASGPVPAGVYCNDDVSSIFGFAAPQALFTPRSSNPTKHRNLDAGRGAIGAFLLNTTGLANGVHTIMWGVADSNGRNDGIGSRFFTVLNAGSSRGDGGAGRTDLRQAPETSVGMLLQAPAIARGRAADIDELPLGSENVWGRTGLDADAPWVEMTADSEDGARHVRMPDLGRLEVFVGEQVERGYLVANGTLRDLPPGSHLDRETGVFTWAPGVGYLGEYRLVFLRAGERIPVTVTIAPMAEPAPGERGLRMAIDTPRSGSTLPGSVRIAGWALDTRAAIGNGVSAVHVWAQRLDAPGSAPAFLGAAALGGSRPDVAMVYGAQFGRAAFDLTTAPLGPGTYDLTVYVMSARTGRWEDARTVSVTIR